MCVVRKNRVNLVQDEKLMVVTPKNGVRTIDAKITGLAPSFSHSV